MHFCLTVVSNLYPYDISKNVMHAILTVQQCIFLGKHIEVFLILHKELWLYIVMCVTFLLLVFTRKEVVTPIP